jgi:branched-chain amino acid aminotransferase
LTAPRHRLPPPPPPRSLLLRLPTLSLGCLGAGPCFLRLRELALQEEMELGLASLGALPPAPPLAGWLTRHSLSPCLNKIQNHIYSMPSLSYKVPSVTECHASLSTNYMETSQAVDLDWENLGFGLVETDFMYVAKCGPDGNFSKGEVLPFGPIAVSPSAGVLNYGQGLFEGLKAYRKTDGSILLFHPEENATRMITGADRMCMPAPTVEQFVDAVKQTVLANKRWVCNYVSLCFHIYSIILVILMSHCLIH